MTTRTPAQAFAEMASALVGTFDVTDLLSRLILDCRDAVAADAVGLVVRESHGGLELLAATSHRSEELEILQVQENDGPCIDVIRRGEPLSCSGGDAIAARWPRSGSGILDAGFHSVDAIPMRWQDQVYGGLNVFRRRAISLTPDEVAMAQTFADLATLVIVQAPSLSQGEVQARIEAALSGRIVIEQAKGVVADSRGLPMDEAYDLLRRIADERQETITGVATSLVERAARGEGD
jgi:GAF domain-containing protein